MEKVATYCSNIVRTIIFSFLPPQKWRKWLNTFILALHSISCLYSVAILKNNVEAYVFALCIPVSADVHIYGLPNIWAPSPLMWSS